MVIFSSYVSEKIYPEEWGQGEIRDIQGAELD
jgi:hypothetical protein